jgi:hypothetical protein
MGIIEPWSKEFIKLKPQTVAECFDEAKCKQSFKEGIDGQKTEIKAIYGKCFRELNGHSLCQGCPPFLRRNRGQRPEFY